jgi:hypothetical protein
MDGSGQHPSLLTGPTAQDVSFRYDVSSNTYQITLPGFNEGTLVNTAYNGSSGQPATSSTSQVEEHSFGFVLPLFVTLPVPGSNLSPYTYTSFAGGVHTRGDWPGGRAVQHAGAGGPQAGFGTTNWGSKAVIDATRPRDFAFGSRSEVPEEAMRRVRLEDFL